MIILTTSALAQTISIIPRDYISTFTMSIRDDSTNVNVDYAINTAITSGNYLNFDNIFSLVSNHFYDLELFSDIEKTKSIFKDRVFCTDQDINQLNNDHYDLNKDQYTTYNGSNNDYIVI